MISNSPLKKRILEISFKNKLAHLGSCLTAVDIIKEIYDIKKPEEKFVLSSGHAGLALYVVLENFGGRDAQATFDHHGVHPDRCADCFLHCSTGSLGSGLPIALGMALADRSKNVYCLISDGECAEGSIYEALTIAWDQKVTNLKVYLNNNGWAAYKQLSQPVTGVKILSLWPKLEERWTDSDQFPFLKDQGAHYYTMKEEDYNQALEMLNG